MTIQELIAGASLTRTQVNQIKRNLATFSANKLRGLTEDVARAEEGSIMTRQGLNILAKGIAGKLIHFTRVAIGDSMQNDELVELTDEQILNLTNLINPLQDVPIVGCQSTGGGVAVVQAFINNANYQSGFWCREMGLFAKDPDSGDEVLYSYRNTGLLSSYTPGNQGAVIVNRKVNLVTVVQNAQNITATIDASVVFVNQAELLAHVNSDNPHPNFPIADYDEPINYTFNLNKTYLYRSTALIEEGRASGSSAQRESVFAPDDIFQGVAASSTQTLTLKTTQANAANFEFNGAFNSGGFFTLA